jgi:cell shape-determining protein MreC
MLFTWLMLGGLILLLAPQSLTGKFQLGFVRVFRWPLSIGGGLALSSNTQQTFTNMVPRREYVKLENHCNNVQQALTQQREKFKRLSALCGTDGWDGASFVYADIITPSIDRSRGGLTVKYPRSARLARGQYVLGDNSIIGTVSDFAAGTAHITLFTDPKSEIPVKTGEGIERMMRGCGNYSAKIPLLPKTKKIKVGDKIYASNSKTLFLDAPVIVGKIAEVKPSRKKPLELDVTVKPACDIAELENVAIIIMDPRK